MGCCGSGYDDKELKEAKSMPEIISVMKKRSEELVKEKNEISNHLEDPTKEVTMVNIEGLSNDDLEKRIEYLDKLHDGYEDVIQTLESINLPIEETKGHLLDIMSHRLISYDLSDNFKNDIAKFKQFAYENEKRLTEGFKKPLQK
jgi:hypothetical protein